MMATKGIKWEVFSWREAPDGSHESIGWCATVTADDYYETLLRMEKEAREIYGDEVGYVAPWKGDPE